MSNEFDFLRTRPEDEEFHSSRVMFWVVNGEIKVAPQGTTMSHLEMAEREGWVDEETTETFFRQNLRGFLLRTGSESRIHFYRGVGFEFDEDVISLAKGTLPMFVEELGIDLKTKVYFGPKDSVINGVEYLIQFEGTVEQILGE